MAAPTMSQQQSANNQSQQGGNDWVVGGNLNIDKTSPAVGKLYINAVEVTATAAELNTTTGKSGPTPTITPAASTANICLVTVQLVDANAANIAVVKPITIWLSDAATGIGLTGTTASGAVAAGASGTDLGVLTTKKAIKSITDATGKYILSITDTAKTGFYIAVESNDKVTVSAQLVTGNYG